uniref:Uncharacterized protein n=1 Tax=Molossus molossus TaxID=27622 RepID=A0A7J8DC37_MOLMO|nr:hypothetical protein HJG59_009413 [Molossus molossus]
MCLLRSPAESRGWPPGSALHPSEHRATWVSPEGRRRGRGFRASFSVLPALEEKSIGTLHLVVLRRSRSKLLTSVTQAALTRLCFTTVQAESVPSAFPQVHGQHFFVLKKPLPTGHICPPCVHLCQTSTVVGHVTSPLWSQRREFLQLSQGPGGGGSHRPSLQLLLRTTMARVRVELFLRRYGFVLLTESIWETKSILNVYCYCFDREISLWTEQTPDAHGNCSLAAPFWAQETGCFSMTPT